MKTIKWEKERGIKIYINLMMKIEMIRFQMFGNYFRDNFFIEFHSNET